MVQLELSARPRRDETHIESLERVSVRIGLLVLAYCRAVLAHAPAEFRMGDLTEYVTEREQCAPDSPGRILRLLKSKGRVGYELLSRRESLYRVDFVR